MATHPTCRHGHLSASYNDDDCEHHKWFHLWNTTSGKVNCNFNCNIYWRKVPVSMAATECLDDDCPHRSAFSKELYSNGVARLGSRCRFSSVCDVIVPA
jgi:hypothetical protein